MSAETFSISLTAEDIGVAVFELGKMASMFSDPERAANLRRIAALIDAPIEERSHIASAEHRRWCEENGLGWAALQARRDEEGGNQVTDDIPDAPLLDANGKMVGTARFRDTPEGIVCDASLTTGEQIEITEVLSISWPMSSREPIALQLDCVPEEHESPQIVKTVPTATPINPRDGLLAAEAVARLLALPRGADGYNHITADQILCETLIKLGYVDVVAAYNQMRKWYE